MGYESFSVSEIVPAEPARIYAAWLSSDEHSAFTGDDATIEPFVGGKHSTFGGYAVGSTVELQPGARIVQTWRAEDFPPGTPDSRVEVTLEPTVGGTMVTILHTAIPSGQGDSYRDGWLKFYLEALKAYFEAPARTNGVSRPSAAKRLAGAKSAPKKKRPAAKPKRAIPAKSGKKRARARPAAKAKAKKLAKTTKKKTPVKRKRGAQKK